jgi:hypothetical protein
MCDTRSSDTAFRKGRSSSPFQHYLFSTFGAKPVLLIGFDDLYRAPLAFRENAFLLNHSETPTLARCHVSHLSGPPFRPASRAANLRVRSILNNCTTTSNACGVF